LATHARTRHCLQHARVAWRRIVHVPPFSTLRTSDGDAVVAEDTVELLRDGADRRRLFSYKLVLDRIPPVVPAAGSLAGGWRPGGPCVV
jgi:hypothetical protein